MFAYASPSARKYGDPVRNYVLTGVPLADYPLVITDYAAVEDLVVPKSE